MLHDNMPYDLIQGQGLEIFKVGIFFIFTFFSLPSPLLTVGAGKQTDC